jgi:hypothetical protein
MKPPKESNTHSGPRGLHLIGALTRTQRKLNLPLLKNIAHPYKKVAEPLSKYQSTSFKGSGATIGCDN